MGYFPVEPTAKAGESRPSGAVDQVSAATAVRGAEADNRAFGAFLTGEQGGPSVFTFDRIGGYPDRNGFEGLFNVVQVPVGPRRRRQMVNQAGPQATGPECAAHIDPVSGGQVDQTEPSHWQSSRSDAVEHQGVGTGSIVWLHGHHPASDAKMGL
jgi:hypothetical protein